MRPLVSLNPKLKPFLIDGFRPGLWIDSQFSASWGVFHPAASLRHASLSQDRINAALAFYF